MRYSSVDNFIRTRSFTQRKTTMGSCYPSRALRRTSSFLNSRKNGCRNAKKKAYADVLEALFWGATTASNEELVFSNSSTKKTKDDISSPTLADEAGDRRLRIKDAIVIAINSDKSNGTLAGQLFSSLIKKALFDESTATPIDADGFELCLAIVITNEKNANSVGQRSFRENIVGELAKLIAENPALRLRATTASDCLLACLRTICMLGEGDHPSARRNPAKRENERRRAFGRTVR